ncbi:MAG: glycerol-3-phosphate dehydrogenase/oxidase [Bdellovibrionales bacterium]|nr:glycerol-3-phosphate dehydrogenase/oxidase [Bdellovibrionales bacterium]
MQSQAEFSPRKRQETLERFSQEKFDVLVVGGGITGAAVARDCVSRGLSVALLERRDFSYGTSSRSSKLIHGGLRYLENFEFKLVFEALTERALLLKNVPHMVRPLPFYFPVYEGDRTGKTLLGIGMWLYDLLALFRTPGYHRSFSKKKLLQDLPQLRKDGLKGGFRYYDASMWDDVLGVEILRDASRFGAAVANYVEATTPFWQEGRIQGFEFRDLESGKQGCVLADQVIVCAGPWTDELGRKLASGPEQKEWRNWLAPSKGVHLIFDLKKLPLPGAMVMSEQKDGRISFVIPRPDFGAGVLIVGTTDGPTPQDPDRAEIGKDDIEYLLGLLNRYFPTVGFQVGDILSAYIGVRPLAIPPVGAGELADSKSLQKVSREHHIDSGPGGTVLVAGGKYTTHRTMAEEIVAFALSKNRVLQERQKMRFSTKNVVNPRVTPAELQRARENPRSSEIEKELWDRYGAEALEILSIDDELKERKKARQPCPEGFPRLEAQLRFSIRHGMVVRLEDFYFRRLPLFFARADHGLPWVDELASAWAEELGKTSAEAQAEASKLREEFNRREKWRAACR